MNLAATPGILENLQVDRLLWHIKTLNLGTLVQNPWFLGGMGLLALIALFMKWRIVLATILSLTGFAWVITYVIQKDTTIKGLSSENLIILAGGGVATVIIVIYLLFIKTD